MSLINTVLKDLEARRAQAAPPDPQAVYRGLRPVGVDRSRVRAAVWAGAAAVALAAVGAGLWWTGLLRTPAPAAPSASAPPVAEASVAPAPVSMPGTPAPTRIEAAAPATQVARPAARATPAAAAAIEPLLPSARIEITAREPSAHERAENAYREAGALLRQGRGAEAETGLRAALAADARHIRAREQLAVMLVEQGRWLEANAVLETGIALLPSHVPFSYMQARLLVEQGQDAAALQLLEKVRPYAAGDANVMGLLGTLCQRSGRHAEALGYLQEAARLQPDNGRWWVGLGISFEAEGNASGAREAYRRARTAALDAPLAEYSAQRLDALRER